MAISVNYILRANNSEQWVEGLFGLSAPNFIQWSSNSGTAVTGEITDGLITFKDLIPNYNGVFTFDLSHFARARMQQVERGDIRADYNEFEQGLAVKFTATVKVNLSAGSPDTLAINPFWFIAAYRQVKNTDKASFWREGVTTVQEGVTALGRVLLPTDNLMRFEGYPIDVNIFHNDFRGSNEKPYRIFRTDSDDVLIGSVGLLPETEDFGVVCVQVDDIPEGGAKIWTATTGNDTRVQRPFTIHTRDFDGVYLRWLNSFGGWSYWLFEGRKVERLSQENNGAAELWTPDPFRVETVKGLQKSSVMRWGIGTAGIERWMFEHLQDLPVSRNVYLWQGERACSQTCVWRVEGVLEYEFGFFQFTIPEILTGGTSFTTLQISHLVGGIAGSALNFTMSGAATRTRKSILDAIAENFNSLSGAVDIDIDYETGVVKIISLAARLTNPPNNPSRFTFQSASGTYTNLNYCAGLNQGGQIILNGSWNCPSSNNLTGQFWYEQSSSLNFQIFRNGTWVTVTPTDGVYESAEEFTAWRIIDSESNIIQSGTPTIDCRIQGDWLPVQVTQFSFTPQRESEIKQIAVEIELPEQYTPVI